MSNLNAPTQSQVSNTWNVNIIIQTKAVNFTNICNAWWGVQRKSVRYTNTSLILDTAVAFLSTDASCDTESKYYLLLRNFFKHKVFLNQNFREFLSSILWWGFINQKGKNKYVYLMSNYSLLARISINFF